MDVNDIIKIWQECHKSAANNPSIQLLPHQNPFQEKLISNICITKMDALSNADELLLTIPPDAEIPPELRKWLEVEKNKEEGKQGCGSCWFSSRKDKNHPECEQKIQEYFEARDALENLYLLPLFEKGEINRIIKQIIKENPSFSDEQVEDEFRNIAHPNVSLYQIEKIRKLVDDHKI